jgi:hypothetical protein
MTRSYKGPMTTANATLQISGWDEQEYGDRESPGKLSEAKVQQTISGDIEGSTDVRWLMAYSADDRAEFVGIQVVTGTLGGKEGTFVLRSVGTYDGSKADGELTVVEGSGTGELAGISGTGSFTAPLGDTAELTLDYELS